MIVLATKIRQPYDKTKKEIQEGPREKEEQKSGDKKDWIVAAEAVAAPIWRRVVAFAIDAAIGLGISYFFILATLVETTASMTSWLYMFSILVTQLWLFGLIPADMWLGQTVGRKIMRLYERNVETKKVNSVFKMFLRDYIYGLLLVMATVPFDFFSLAFQYFFNKQPKEQTTQMLPIAGKDIVLPRDSIFKVEVVYLPKKVKNDTGDVAETNE